MNNKRFSPVAMAAVSSVFAFGLFAQGPVGDEVKVTFDRAVQVGSQTLPAGDYTIRQVTSASNPRVLEFMTSQDNKLVATVTAIPVMQNTPPSETKVILQDEGGGARLSRIWVQGKTYGYGFPGQAMAASQSTMASAQLSGSYAAAPTAVASADRVVDTPPSAAVETPTAATPAPTPTPAVEAPVPQPASDTVSPPVTPDIPATGLGWVEAMAFGLTLASLGMFLYRREARRS